MKKYLFLILVTLQSQADDFANVGIEQAKVNGGDLHTYYNADVDTLNDNSWKFTSNTNNRDCIAVDGVWKDWNCKRGDVKLVEWYQYEATMKYKFTFNIEKYPSWPSPYWMIVLQDWRKQNPNDSMGRHPMTTLKLKNFKGGLYLAHYDNSWQWGYEFPHDDLNDTVHSMPDWGRGCWGDAPKPNDGIHHQENTCNGAFKLQLNTDYDVEFIISPSHASLSVNGFLVSYAEYKTKSHLEWSHIAWGMYWDKHFNTTNDERYQVIYTISNFKRMIKTTP